MKYLLIISFLFSILFPAKSQSTSMDLYYDNSEPSIEFAAKDLQRILSTRGTDAELKSLEQLPEAPNGPYIVIAVDARIF